MNDVKEGSQERLSDSEYWSGIHEQNPPVVRPQWKRILRGMIPQGLLDARKRWWEQRDWKREQRGMNDHWLHQLIEVLLRPRIQVNSGWKGLEIGSAPGRISLELWRRLGLVPHGLEYTESGVQAQKALFCKFGLSEELVMHGDLFDSSWRKQHAETFDLVASFGLIEHFGDPEDVAAKHLELLRPGGILVLTVPNLNESTWYGRLVRRYNPPVYAIHNTRTCTREALREIASSLECDIIHCDTLGGPSIDFIPDSHRESRCISRILHLIRPMTNQLNHLCIGNRLKSFPRTASSLALVAIKKPRPMEGKTISEGNER